MLYSHKLVIQIELKKGEDYEKRLKPKTCQSY